jgi:hypothetical protein
MDFLTPQIMHSRAARRRSSSRASRSTSSTSLLTTRPPARPPARPPVREMNGSRPTWVRTSVGAIDTFGPVHAADPLRRGG